MIYKLSLVLNTVCCILFILIELFMLAFAPASLPAESAMVFHLISFVGLISLIFNIICFKLLKFNKEKIPVASNFIRLSNVFFSLTIISAFFFLLMGVAVSVAIQEAFTGNQIKMTVFFILFIVIFLACGVSSIFNVILLRKLLKKNRQIIFEEIQNIGN